jgi:hypothetical protein
MVLFESIKSLSDISSIVDFWNGSGTIRNLPSDRREPLIETISIFNNLVILFVKE